MRHNADRYRMRWGDHEGKRFDELPREYLQGLLDRYSFLLTSTELSIIKELLAMPEKKTGQEQAREQPWQEWKGSWQGAWKKAWGDAASATYEEIFRQAGRSAQNNGQSAAAPPKAAVDYEQIVRSWARQVMREHHPDRGGDPKVFNAPMESVDSLKRLLGIT